MSDLHITGWTKEAVRAFAHVVEDDPDTAVRIVRDMSPKDRAVLSFWLNELSGIVDAAEVARMADQDIRTRAFVRGEDSPADRTVSLEDSWPDPRER